METLKKLDGIAEKWSKAKPVSSHAKNYELIWDRIKDLNAQSEDHNGVMRPAYATCHRNFHNTKKLETNSKQKTSEIDEQNSKDIDHIDDDRTNSEKSLSALTWSSGANIVYQVCFIFEKDELHYSQYGSLKHENLIRCELSSGEVSLKRAMIDNLESDEPSLVVATKRLKIWYHIISYDIISYDII